ncbi:MAG: hypothetical protein HRT50_00090 [Colwellia sp.]|uniref:hypothetical protein n=1 Tax=Colwellia sp. TaxID=56799 RepID=UPI001D6FCC7C|nr:hypothetical protein [Colwellia sp.]NQY47507.1 hypothetical protein [Colwellia sp.]
MSVALFDNSERENKHTNYTQATSRCRIQLELETSLGKALNEENSYSIVEVNNVA